MLRRFLALAGVWLSFWLLTACNQVDNPTGTLLPGPPTVAPTPLPTAPTNRRLGYADAPVARVNGKEVSAADFNRALDQTRVLSEDQNGGVLDWNTTENKKLLTDLRLQTLEGLINYTVIEQEAQKEAITVTPAEIETRAADQKKQLGGDTGLLVYLARRFLSDEDNKKSIYQGLLFEKMQERHSQAEDKAEQAKVRHILVATEGEAKTILDKLRAGGDFVALARQFSLDSVSAQNGGDLDWLFRGQTDENFERVAFALKISEFSTPVKTKFGWHIVQVQAKEVRSLPADLVAQRRTEAFANYIKALRDKAAIEKLLK